MDPQQIPTLLGLHRIRDHKWYDASFHCMRVMSYNPTDILSINLSQVKAV
jgi:hypothetical protein